MLSFYTLDGRSQRALALAFVLAVFGILAGLSDFWMPGGSRLLASGSYALVPALVALLYALARSQFCRPIPTEANRGAFVEAGAWIVAVLFLSDWLSRTYNFYQGPSIRGELIFFGGVALVALRFGYLTQKVMQIILCLTILLAMLIFLDQSAGRVIFSDDHSVFAYRLQLLVETFPQIPFYNPFWNAGLDARDSLATGALGLYILGLPWLYLFPVAKVYNFIIIWILLIQLPLGCYLATRLSGFTARAGALAGLLSLASSLHWYRWALKYGTMGFVNSATLLTLVVVLAALLVKQFDLPRRWIFLFIVCTSICLLWPFFGVVLLPVFAALVFFWLADLVGKKFSGFPGRGRRIFFTGLVLLVVNLPWMLVFVGTSGLLDFLQAHKKAPLRSAKIVVTDVDSNNSSAALQAVADSLQTESDKSSMRFRNARGHIDAGLSLKMLRKVSFAANPLLIFMGLLGLFLLSGFFRWFYIMQLAWLFLLGAVLFPIKPQLELDRLLVLALLMLALPAGAAIDRLIQLFENQRLGIRALPVGLVLGFVLTGPVLVFSVLKNRSTEHFSFRSQMVDDFTNFLNAYKPAGRILFAGCVIHEFGDGHLASLAGDTDHPMIASSHAHTLWWYKDVFPGEFLARGDEGREEFMRLFNVSDVFAHEPKWKKYFRARPDKYELIWNAYGFELFRLKNYSASYFLEGQGQIIDQEVNSIRLRVESADALISFNYSPALEAAPCKLSGQEVYSGREFIRLTDCAGQEVRLTFKPPWQQLFLTNRRSIS